MRLLRGPWRRWRPSQSCALVDDFPRGITSSEKGARFGFGRKLLDTSVLVHGFPAPKCHEVAASRSIDFVARRFILGDIEVRSEQLRSRIFKRVRHWCSLDSLYLQPPTKLR